MCSKFILWLPAPRDDPTPLQNMGYNAFSRPRRYCVAMAVKTVHSENAFAFTLDLVRPDLDEVFILFILEHCEDEVPPSNPPVACSSYVQPASFLVLLFLALWMVLT